MTEYGLLIVLICRKWVLGFLELEQEIEDRRTHTTEIESIEQMQITDQQTDHQRGRDDSILGNKTQSGI